MIDSYYNKDGITVSIHDPIRAMKKQLNSDSDVKCTTV
jgi:hypothetical protein